MRVHGAGGMIVKVCGRFWANHFDDGLLNFSTKRRLLKAYQSVPANSRNASVYC